MRRSTAGLVVLLALLAAPLAAPAQPRATVPRLGVLSPFAPGAFPPFEAFTQGLRDLGWVEGETLAIEYRWAEGRTERLPGLAAELARLHPDVVFSAYGTPTALAAQAATRTIPIVFAGIADAVGVGLVQGLARPGGNATGVTFLAEETTGKQFQLLKEAVPRLARVALLRNPANPIYARQGPILQAAAAAAQALALQLQVLDVAGPDDFDRAFRAATRGRAGGLVVVRDQVINLYPAKLVQLAATHRLPAMYGLRAFVEAGGLMAFGPKLSDAYRSAAHLVDKILRGAKPADLPVEQVTRFELAVNLKTAKALGLTLPPSVLILADEVIQ